MFPISHSDETSDVGNMDGTNVALHDDGDENETGNQELDICSSKNCDSITSHLSHKIGEDKTASAVNKSANQRQASDRFRYTGSKYRNCSSVSVEKRRDRQWGNERSHKADNRRKKVLSNPGDREQASSVEMSNELTNGEAAAAKPLMETVSHDCCADNKTQVLTEIVDPTDHVGDHSKSVMPSTRKPKRYSGRYDAYGRSHLSGASYSKYSDDYDDYVVQPKHYRGQKSNSRPKLMKTNADAVYNNDRNDDDDDDDDDSNCDHAMHRSTILSKYRNEPKDDRGQKSKSQPKSVKTATDAASNDAGNDFDDDTNCDHTESSPAVSTKKSYYYVSSRPKQYRGQKTNTQPKSVKVNADAVSVNDRNDSGADSNHDHAVCKSTVSKKNGDDLHEDSNHDCSADNPAESSKYSRSELKHCRGNKTNKQPKSVKTANNKVSNDARNDLDEGARDSQLSHTVCSSSVSTKPDSALASDSKRNKIQFSDLSRQKQRNGYHSHQNKKDLPTDLTLDENSTSPATAASTKQYQNNKSDICNSTETNFRTKNYLPRKRWDRKGPDKARRLSVNSDEQLQKTTDASSHLSVEVCNDDNVQLEHGAAEVQKDCPTDLTVEDRATSMQHSQNNKSDTCNSTETKLRTKSYQPRKHWNRKGPDKARSSVDGDGQLQKTTDAFSNLSVKVCNDNYKQLERGAAELLNDSNSSQQKHVKQSNVCQASTDSGSQEIRSQRRRKNHTQRDDARLTKQQHGPDHANDCSHAQKEQRNGRGHYDARRNVCQDSKSGDYQNSYDSRSERVDRQPESSSTKRHSGHHPGFRVYYRRASATAQLPTS